MKLVGFFPGQGSQAVGMGKDFYLAFPLANKLFSEANRVLKIELSALCFDGPLEKLTLTEFAQPAILATSYVAYRLASLTLAAAAGHSLGEYTALVAAESLTFADALLLVHKRGRYMQEAVPAGAGKMVAVLGPTEKEIRQVLETVPEGVKQIANLNSPGQTVVAGDVRGVDAFAAAMKQKGGKIIPLNVSAPFHCSLMEPAANALAKDLDAISFADPKMPVYANVTGKAVRSGNEARELLKQQVCSAVRWVDCVRTLVQEQQVTQAVEFGPGGVLAKLLKRICPEIPCREIFDSASLEQANAS